MNDSSNGMFYLQIAIALFAFVCAARLAYKATSFHANLWIAGIVFIICTGIFSLVAVHLPLYFMANSQRIQHHLTVDLMMFGAAGLFLVAIIGFAIDHIFEKPNMLMVAAAACISVGIFPYIYGWSRDTLNQKYEINIVEPTEPKEAAVYQPSYAESGN